MLLEHSSLLTDLLAKWLQTSLSVRKVLGSIAVPVNVESVATAATFPRICVAQALSHGHFGVMKI